MEFLNSEGLKVLEYNFELIKKHSYKQSCRFMWYQKLSSKQRMKVLNMPHFVKSIFEEITGINVPNLRRFKND